MGLNAVVRWLKEKSNVGEKIRVKFMSIIVVDFFISKNTVRVKAYSK